MAFFGNSKKEDSIYNSNPKKSTTSDVDEAAVREALKSSTVTSNAPVVDAEFRETTEPAKVETKKVNTSAAVSNNRSNNGGTTFLTADVAMNGAINSSSDIVIEGTFEGPIHTSGVVTVRNGGKVVGDISAKELSIIDATVEGSGEASTVIINGTMKGDVIADSVTVGEKAFLDGDVSTKGLVISIGARVHGKFDVNTLDDVASSADKADTSEPAVKSKYSKN